MNVTEFVKDRNNAFISFVKTDDLSEFYKYADRYQLSVPSDINITKAGIYKAVQECTDIPEDIKEIARKKCMELDFAPYICS